MFAEVNNNLSEGIRENIRDFILKNAVAVDAKNKNYILGECKFRNSVMGSAELDKLKEKASLAKSGAAIWYALFSKSGFAKNLTDCADETVKLFTLTEIMGS
ncbi:hypothetical protein FACS1894127_7070 [Clostridia bacterium]|nr:hypothetical protein FACS1894127_7070 [Clostridia bacterium]